MKVSVGILLRGAFWTVGGFGAVLVLRVVSNIFLTRFLAPQLFGLMAIVNTLRVGIELISDLGIAQNIIYSPDANEPDYYNTAWTLQIIRSVLLWLVIVAASVPLARFYDLPILVYLLPVTGIATITSGLTSMSPVILQKRLLFVKLNAYQLILGLFLTPMVILIAYFNRTVWALIFGGLFTSAVTAGTSYFLLPEIKHRFLLNKKFGYEIVSFGKWIFLSSIVYFLSTNFDRLYFAKVVPLEVLGIYSIARSIAELLNAIAGRLGNTVVFPFVASHSNTPRETLRAGLVSIRARFLLLAALGCSLLIAGSDLAIALIYDQRYQAAGWMLPVLAIGSWFFVVASLNESTLLGVGAPSYMAVSNSLKFILLLVGLPLSFKLYGFPCAVMAVSLIEACRYFPVWVGQKRQRFSYARQDLSITIAMFMMIAFWEWLRWIFGFGTSFDSFPLRKMLSS
ncbi:MAG: oligosaccharide flippase family protein [Roseiarcus sp.]